MKAVGKYLAIVLSVAAFGPASAADRDLSMDIQPVFMGIPVRGAVALSVRVANSGPDAQGRVVVKQGGFRITLPVSLPKGSQKRLTAYIPEARQYEFVEAELETDKGRATAVLRDPGSPPGSNYAVGFIGDTSGVLGFLRTPTHRDDQITQDCYVKPANAPERPAGYAGLLALVLGEGAERLSDASVAAIQSWVLRGGRALLIGGASDRLYRDPRWKSILPLRDAKLRTVAMSPSDLPAPSSIREMPGQSKDDPTAREVTVLAGELTPEATGVMRHGIPIVATTQVGAGSVSFLAFDPFEPPMNNWLATSTMFDYLVALPEHHKMQRGVRILSGLGSEEEFGIHGRRISHTQAHSGDPFNVQMPSALHVVGILTLYTVLVVFGNLLILRKLGRGEMAWVTTPIISLAFAGVFFSFAGALYSAEMSRASEGILLTDARTGRGYLLGVTKLFVPRGGSYDLGGTGIDTVDVHYGERVYYDSRDAPRAKLFDALDPIDTGRELDFSRFRSSNLAFYEFVYGQGFETKGWFEASVNVNESEVLPKIGGRLVNRSPYPLRTAYLFVGKNRYHLPDIEPGQSVSLDGLVGRPVPAELTYADLREGRNLTHMTPSHGIVLSAALDGFHPGIQIGKDVESYRRIRVAASLGRAEVQQ